MNIVFSNQQIQTIVEDNVLWFKATDVSKALGYLDPQSVIRKGKFPSSCYKTFETVEGPRLCRALAAQCVVSLCGKRSSESAVRMVKVLETSVPNYKDLLWKGT